MDEALKADGRIVVLTVAADGTEVPDRKTSRLAIRPGLMAEALDTEEYKAYRQEG